MRSLRNTQNDMISRHNNEPKDISTMLLQSVAETAAHS